jgi:hypothetical protein
VAVGSRLPPQQRTQQQQQRKLQAQQAAATQRGQQRQVPATPDSRGMAPAAGEVANALQAATALQQQQGQHQEQQQEQQQGQQQGCMLESGVTSPEDPLLKRMLPPGLAAAAPEAASPAASPSPSALDAIPDTAARPRQLAPAPELPGLLPGGSSLRLAVEFGETAAWLLALHSPGLLLLLLLLLLLAPLQGSGKATVGLSVCFVSRACTTSDLLLMGFARSLLQTTPQTSAGGR